MRRAIVSTAVTFTIAVCNNTVFATPVVLSEQLPPSFTVTGASIWSGVDTTQWSTEDTTLTLNNGQCAQFMITGYFTAFGEFTNTVTLDTDTAAGPELTASATVIVVSACASEHIIPDSSLASVVGTVFSGTTVTIMGQFIVDDDVLFQNAEVFMEEGAEIVVLPGRTLDIMSSSVTSCQQVMWKGITAQDGSTVRMRGSFVDDAENMITALDGSTLWLRSNQFHNNRTTIHVPESEGVPWNNVAAYIRDNTFYSQGAMPQPYPGQATAVGAVGFAAFDVKWMVLDLTDGNNIIHTMSNGIVAHNSDLRVADCRMLAIQPDAAYAYVGNGAGIYAFGGKGWNTLEQEGYGMDYTPSFENCRWGIYTEYMNVYSTDNQMLNMGTAYRIDRSGLREVDILNNRVHTKYHGMDLRFNDGALHMLVEGNDITFGNSYCDVCRGYSGIFVSEGNLLSEDSRIKNNTIRYVAGGNSRFGISLIAAADWLVADNELLMASNAHNLTGIHLGGCDRPLVSCNTITGASATSYPLAAQSAIRNIMGNDPLIRCNEVDMTSNGILFNGVAPNTDVRGNFFHNHQWPLHLDATAVIGVQDRTGNLWDPNAVTPILGAWNEDSLNASFSGFFYNSATINGGNTQPPSWSPSNWFNFAFGTNYDCANHHGVDYCSQFKVKRDKEQLTELDVRVAGDSLDNVPYTDESKWMLEGRLYKKLDENPDLLDSLQAMADLYAALQGSTTADLKQIDDEQLQLYGLDSMVIDQLKANRLEVDSLLALMQSGLGQLEDTTLTFTQLQAIIASLAGYRQQIGDLLAWNAGVLQTASESKVSATLGLQASNAAVYVSELIEVNQKAINEIYLATIGKDVDTFTSAQADDLFGIANQCPMVGGNAVFKARSLYWLIDDGYDFDDGLLCLPHDIVVKNLHEPQVNVVTVVPNPASDEASLVLAQELKSPGILVMYDALGMEVLRRGIPVETKRLVFSTVTLSPALYQFQVLLAESVIGCGKLTILR